MQVSTDFYPTSRQARIAAKLHHTNIVEAYNVHVNLDSAGGVYAH